MRSIKLNPTRSGVIQLIEEALRMGGSDVHLKAPGRPHVRVEDRLVPTAHDRVSAVDMRQVMAVLLELAGEEHHLAAVRDTRFAIGIESLGRFRVQAVRQRGSWGVVIHVIGTEPPSIVDVGIESARELFAEGSGLVLVGGGRRRSQVVASLVREYNQSTPGHIVSIEEPMDFLHKDHRASVTQREVGQDVDSFYAGIVAALRQDPDAVALTDVPDADTAEAVLRAAEEGLLVFAGVGAVDGSQAVRAFTRRFTPAREQESYLRVASVLRGVIAAPNIGPAVYMPTHGAASDGEDVSANVA